MSLLSPLARRRLRDLERPRSTARIPNGAVLLILFAVVVFLVGLVSEQVSALRFAGASQAFRCDRSSSFLRSTNATTCR